MCLQEAPALKAKSRFQCQPSPALSFACLRDNWPRTSGKLQHTSPQGRGALNASVVCVSALAVETTHEHFQAAKPGQTTRETGRAERRSASSDPVLSRKNGVKASEHGRGGIKGAGADVDTGSVRLAETRWLIRCFASHRATGSHVNQRVTAQAPYRRSLQRPGPSKA